MILEIVAIVLIILFSIIAALLLIPFHVILYGSASATIQKFEVRISWLGLTVWRIKPSSQISKDAKVVEKAQTKESGLSRARRIIPVLWESVPALVILARSFRRAIHLRKLKLDLTFGLGDPVDTALLAGYLWSIQWAVNRMRAVSFSFEPSFQKTGLDGSINAEITATMLFLILGFLRAYLKKPFRQLVKEARSGS